MKKIFLTFISIFLFNFLYSKTVVIPFEGEINAGIYKYLKRASEDAINLKPSQIIFEINTFGGRLDAAYKIVELISSLKFKTIALVNEKAISAGALIALSCHQIYMMPNTTIGDCAPIMMGQGGPKMMGEKFQSPLRAKFRALAKKNGYPIKLSEAMVSLDKEVIEITWNNGKKEMLTEIELKDLNSSRRKKIVSKKTIISKGELLTMSDSEAKDFGFSKKTVLGVEELIKEGEEIIKINLANSEKIYFALANYLWLFILIGLAGIYLEVKSSGFGFYGIIAILSFSIFFLLNYIVELANYYEFALLLVSIGLISVEIFVLPGFGFFGILGIFFLLFSLILMMQSFTIPSNPLEFFVFKEGVTMVLGSFLISIPVFIILVYLMVKLSKVLPFGLMLTSRQRDGVVKKVMPSFGLILGNRQLGGVAKKEMKSSLLSQKKQKEVILKKGVIGVTQTALRPAGKMLFNKKVWDVVSKGVYLEKGKKVVVIDFSENKIIVELY